MADVKPKMTVLFEIKLSTADLIENKVPWGKEKTTEIIAEMRNIRYEDDGETIVDDGEHTIPFWACEVAQAVFKEISTKSGKKPVWTELAYVREIYEDTNWEGEVKEFSNASIGAM